MTQEIHFIGKVRDTGPSYVVTMPKMIRDVMQMKSGDIYEFSIVRKVGEMKTGGSLKPVTTGLFSSLAITTAPIMGQVI